MVEDVNRVHIRIDELHGRMAAVESRQAGIEVRQAEHAARTEEIRNDVKLVLGQVNAIAVTIAGREAAGQHSGKMFGWFTAFVMAIAGLGSMIINLWKH